MAATRHVKIREINGRPLLSTFAICLGISLLWAIALRTLDDRYTDSAAIASTPAIIPAFKMSEITGILTDWMARMNGDAVTPEPPRRRSLFEGTSSVMNIMQTI